MTVTLYWCDACHGSIPEADLVSGAATRMGGRLLCGSCQPAAPATTPPLPTAGISWTLHLVWVLALALALGSWWQRRTPETPNESRPAAPDAPTPIALAARIDVLAKSLSELNNTVQSSQQRSASLPVPTDIESKLVDLRARVAQISIDFELIAQELRASIRREATSRDALEAKTAAIESRLAAMAASIAELTERAVARRPEVTPTGESPEAAPTSRPESLPTPEVPAAPPKDPDPIPGISPELVALVARLRDPAAGVRFTAVVALGGSRSPAAVKPLVEALRDRESYVRDAAARALRSVGSKEAVPSLIRALGDTDDFVRYSARDALRALTGMSLPFNPEGTKVEREASIRAIERWWETQRARE